MKTFNSTFTMSLAAVAIIACDEKHPKAVTTPPPIVMVAKPVERTVTDYQVFTARTQAVQSVDIKARVTGYLTGILFKDGDDVKTGQVLFQIDDRPYKAALDQSKANLEVAKAALIKSQAEYDIGLRVQQQNPGAISQDELTKRLGSRDEAKGQVDLAKAAIENAELNFNWCKVTSPINGRINRHFVDIGNMVTADTTTLTNIVSIRPVWAYFDVDENSFRRYQERVLKGELQSARKNEIPVAIGLAGDSGFPDPGTIDFVSNQLDPNTGSIRVRAVFPNENGTLLAGQFGRVRVPFTAPHSALLVADSAIGSNQGQRYVLVVNDQNEVEYRIVDVGQLHGGLREVHRHRSITSTEADGRQSVQKVEVLKASDRLIVDGLQRVRPGVKVEPKLVDMTTWLLKSESPADKAAQKSK